MSTIWTKLLSTADYFMPNLRLTFYRAAIRTLFGRGRGHMQIFTFCVTDLFAINSVNLNLI